MNSVKAALSTACEDALLLDLCVFCPVGSVSVNLLTPGITSLVQWLSTPLKQRVKKGRAHWSQKCNPADQVYKWMAAMNESGQRVIRTSVLVFLCLNMACSGFAQAQSNRSVEQKAEAQLESTPLQTINLGSGIYLFTGDGGDSVAVVGESDTVLIDSGLQGRAVELSEAVFKAGARPVTRLVNTHWHFDHTGGNPVFGSAGVSIIAQENVKARLSSPQNIPFTGIKDGPYPVDALPSVNYKQSLTLRQGSQEITLMNYGPAHTDGDSVIYLQPANIVVVGDIFSNPYYPLIDLGSGGSISGLISSVDEILERTNDTTKIVPGHGPVASRADLQQYREMLIQVRNAIGQLINTGKSLDEVVASNPTRQFDARWGKGYVDGRVFTEMVYTSMAMAGKKPS